MLVFPGWRPQGFGLECRRAQWAPHHGLAAYVAPTHPMAVDRDTQNEDEYSSSSGDSSPEHVSGGEAWGDITTGVKARVSDRDCVCEWEGCGAEARGVAALSGHVSRAHAHPRQDGLFYCAWSTCTRSHRGFNARYKMLVHVRTHTNEKPHACALCRKCFSRAENLKIHMRSHSGEKPYVCPFEGCSKAYSNSSDRFKHTRTHAIDKPYCCKVPGCDKRYTDPSSLRKHVKTYKHYTNTHGIVISNISPEIVNKQDRITHETLVQDRIVQSTIIKDNIIRDSTPIEAIKKPTEADDRVPAYDMPYVEYSRLCYAPSPSYSNYEILHKGYAYDATPYSDLSTQGSPRQYEHVEETPLDLKRRRTCLQHDGVLVRSIEDSMEFQLVRAMEMPLDLSTNR